MEHVHDMKSRIDNYFSDNPSVHGQLEHLSQKKQHSNQPGYPHQT